MLNRLYSKKVLEYFMHPKNLGVIKNADGVGTVGNPACGDVMRVYIKIQKSQPKAGRPRAEKIKNQNVEIIKDIKVETLGCGAAVATSSIATEMVKGKPLDQALKLTNKAVAEALDGLPPIKMHCSVLAEQGIKAAIEDYKKKKKVK